MTSYIDNIRIRRQGRRGETKTQRRRIYFSSRDRGGPRQQGPGCHLSWDASRPGSIITMRLSTPHSLLRRRDSPDVISFGSPLFFCPCPPFGDLGRPRQRRRAPQVIAYYHKVMESMYFWHISSQLFRHHRSPIVIREFQRGMWKSLGKQNIRSFVFCSSVSL